MAIFQGFYSLDVLIYDTLCKATQDSQKSDPRFEIKEFYGEYAHLAANA